MSEALYNHEILRLAMTLHDRPRLTDPNASAELRSRTCGSRVVVDMDIDRDGFVRRFGQQVHACALGQASAALLGSAIVDCHFTDIIEVNRSLGDYLAGERDDPGAWPGLDVFRPARDYPARHAAIRLPFEAAAQAIRIATA